MSKKPKTVIPWRATDKIRAGALQQFNDATDGFVYMPVLYVNGGLTGLKGAVPQSSERKALNFARARARPIRARIAKLKKKAA